MERWRVGPDEAGQRLDRAVAAHLDVPRNQVQQWIREGRVLLAGAERRASHTVAEGDEISCEPRAKETALDLTPERGELSLLHADEHLLVLDKPAGLAVHPGAGRRTGTLVHRLLAAYPEIGAVGGRDRPGIVHRLDLDTTGVLVVARTETAYRALSRDFARREVAKSYLGIVFGLPDPPDGLIDRPIGRHRRRRKEMTVRPDGRSARTRYRTLASGPGVSLLELDLETGRTHQIRVHLKALRHPLVGDPIYAGNRWRGAPEPVRKRLARFPRPALHAHSLELRHPLDGRTMRFVAPLPGDLVGLWRDLTGSDPPVPAAG